MTRSLETFRVLSFDCYGTLIDWETGIWDGLQPLIAANGGSVEREQALEVYGRFESEIESSIPALPYEDVLVQVHRRLATTLGLSTTDALDRDFAASLPRWPAFPDSADALRALQTRCKLVILSNVSRAGFAASNEKLGVTFDGIYTAEDIGSYKPSLRNFEFLLARLQADLGLAADDLLHVAQSLYHDHAPATRLGLSTAWIDRQGLSRGGSWGATAQVSQQPSVDFTFPDMAAFAEAVCAR